MLNILFAINLIFILIKNFHTFINLLFPHINIIIFSLFPQVKYCHLRKQRTKIYILEKIKSKIFFGLGKQKIFFCLGKQLKTYFYLRKHSQRFSFTLKKTVKYFFCLRKQSQINFFCVEKQKKILILF